MNRPLVRVGQIWRLRAHRYRVVAVDEHGATLQGIDVQGELWMSLADGTAWDPNWHFEEDVER